MRSLIPLLVLPLLAATLACSGVAPHAVDAAPGAAAPGAAAPADAGSTVSDAAAPAARARTTLGVALFPWIPDAANDKFAALRQHIERDFESRHPEIDLELRLEKDDDSYYNPPKLAGWLASGRYDLVEVDTVILGDLIAADVIAPWPARDASAYFPAAVDGATVRDANGSVTWWGVPHLLCGFFLVTDVPAIHAADDLDVLARAVRQTGKPIHGNLDSSWDLPTLYLDARVDNGLPPADVAQAVSPTPDAATADALEIFSDLCAIGRDNPCLDGTFSEAWNEPVLRFVAGASAGYWGYSERLHLTVHALRDAGKPTDGLRVSPLPLGDDATQLLFTDAFVRATACADDPACAAAAEAFVAYINSPASLAYLLLSRDATAVGAPAVPRYLLPAVRAAFDDLRSDPLYGALEPDAEAGAALPNRAELYETRKGLEASLKDALRD